MRLVKLAWRNVMRHRRRTLITAAAIAVGLASMIVSNTMMNGMEKLTSANIINYETGHITVFARGYYREEGLFPLDTVIENSDSAIREITRIPGAVAATGRVKFPAQVSNGIDEYPVLGVGIDRQAEPQVFMTMAAIRTGAGIRRPDDALIGVDLARLLDIEVGGMLTIITRDRNGTFNAHDLTVAGLVNTGHPLIDGNAVLMDIKTARTILDLGGAVTEIIVRIKDASRLEEMKKKIAGAVGAGYAAYSFKELYASVFEVSGLKRSVQFMVALVVVIIAAVGIVNTMLMAVMERITEIGMLKAMGFENRLITRIFLYEGGIIGFFGSVIGLGLGLAFSALLIFVGIDFSRYIDSSNLGYPLKFYLKGELDPRMAAVVFFFGIVVAVLVTLWPVRYAAKLPPVEALRHV